MECGREGLRPHPPSYPFWLPFTYGCPQHLRKPPSESSALVCQSTPRTMLSSPRPCLIIPVSVLSLAQSKDLVAWKARALPEQMNTWVPAGDPVTLSLFFTNSVFPWADDVPNQQSAFYCCVRSAIKPCKPSPPHGSVNKKWNLIKGQVNMKPGQSANIRNLQLQTYSASSILRMAM